MAPSTDPIGDGLSCETSETCPHPSASAPSSGTPERLDREVPPRRNRWRPGPWTFVIAIAAVFLMVASATASPAASPSAASPSSGGHLGTACIPCPYDNNECVPLADCVPPGSDCKPFSVTITSATVNAEGTSIEAFWSSTGYYATTYTFEYGLEGGTLTTVSTGSGTSYTIGTSQGQTYELIVGAKMTCPSGTVYTASASRDVSTTWTWTVSGVVDMATPSGVSKNTPVYGAEVYVQGISSPSVVGSTGSYSFTITNSASSVTVCADAPGYRSNQVGVANPNFAQCNSPVSVSGGATTTDNLLLQLNTTLAQEPESIYVASAPCFQPVQAGCKSSTGMSFSSLVSTSGMVTDQASQVTQSTQSVLSSQPLPPGCTAASTCDLISFSGTTDIGVEGYTYWEVLPLSYYGSGTTGLPLSGPMQLSYYVWEEGDYGHVAMDALFSGGQDLHTITNNLGTHVLDDHGNWIAPSYQFLPQGQWVPVIVDLSEITDQTIEYLSVGMDDGGNGLGAFQAYFADIRLEASQQPSSLVNSDFMQGGLYGWTTGGTTLPVSSSLGMETGGSLRSVLVGDTSGSSTAQTSTLEQEFEVPNSVSSDSVCLYYMAFTNDPTPANGNQRVYIQDLTTGAIVNIVGYAGSPAQTVSGWNQMCVYIMNGDNDIRGDMVWFVLSTSQAGDGYVSYMYVTGIFFTPDNLGWLDSPVSSSSNNYGYNGVDVSPLDEGDLSFPAASFPYDSGVQYLTPFAQAGYASGTYQPAGSSGMTWTGGLLAGIDLIKFTRGASYTDDALQFTVSAVAAVGHGSGTNATCTTWTWNSKDQPCLYVDLIRLGIGFICTSGCGSGTTAAGLQTSSQNVGGGTTAWNLAPTCQCTTGGDNDLSGFLDALGAAVGVAGIVIGAPETGGADLALLPAVLGVAGVGIDGAGLYLDMQPPTAGLPDSGLSCTSAIASTCVSFGWGTTNSSGGPSDGGATMGGTVYSPYTGSGSTYDVVVIAQLQVGEISLDIDDGDNTLNYAQVNEVYLVNVNTA
ncbi:MAG: hypothetical protein WA688_06200 [Thermoplasmata archaeon]